MLITTLLLAAMVQSSPAATVATTRVSFTKCLRDDMKKALEAKVEDVQYEKFKDYKSTNTMPGE